MIGLRPDLPLSPLGDELGDALLARRGFYGHLPAHLIVTAVPGTDHPAIQFVDLATRVGDLGHFVEAGDRHRITPGTGEDVPDLDVICVCHVFVGIKCCLTCWLVVHNW